MNLKSIFFGILTWLIPFVVSFFFFNMSGELTIDKFLFKSIMIVVGSLTACTLLILYFKHVNSDYIKTGFVLGGLWLFINWVLDLVVLIPMSGMSYNDYFAEIGLRYLVIPIMSYTIGRVLETKHRS